MKWLQFLSFLIIGIGFVSPYYVPCSNPCDYYYPSEYSNIWSGWTGWNGWGNWNSNWTHTGLQLNEPQCPKIEKCSDINSRELTKCTTTWDCMRNEVCCNNPCVENKQCMKKTRPGEDVNYDRYLSCPVVYSCSKLVLDYVEPRECEEDNECKRSEKCCTHPCDDAAVGDLPEKMCMKANNYYTQQ